MRASTFIAAALPIGISALPAQVEDRGLLNDAICLPYNIVVNTLLRDPLLVPFCANYINVATSTVTSVVKAAAGAAVIVTSGVTVNGGGAVTITNMATVTAAAGVVKDVTSVVTVAVTVPTATSAATCLMSAYAAPTKVKRGLNSIVLSTTAPGAANGRYARPSAASQGKPKSPVRGEGEALHTAVLPWKRGEQLGARFFNLLGGLFGGSSPAPGPASAPAPVVNKPSPLGNVPRPACIPANLADSAIQIICNCANIPAQVKTVTSTAAGAAAPTVTVMSTTTINARSSVTITNTLTVTPAAAAAKTVTSTTTSTVGFTATSAVPNGLVYKKFTSPFDGYKSASGWTADRFKGNGIKPDFTGVWNSLNFMTPYWPSMSVDPTLQLDQSAPFDASQAALLFQGFFIAPQTGSYTFTVPAENNDNFAQLWTGASALSWLDSASAFKAVRTATTSSIGQAVVSLNAGDAMPFSYLWANGGGAGRSAFNIVFPDGSSPSDFSSLFVQPCNGNVFSQ